MLQKRLDQDHDDTLERSGEIAALETMRSAAASSGSARTRPEEKKEEEKMSLFWRVFGGTILSIVALAAVTLYNNLSTGITDLRAELSREREARAELVKKDEFNTRTTNQYERIRAVEGMNVNLSAIKTDLESLKERMAARNTTLDTLKKDLAALDVIRERVIALEAVKKELAGLEVQKEKLAALAGDLKGIRDDLQKAQQDVEKNKAADLERKSYRDTQAKQLDDTLKELHKGLQDCREKLARLEGSASNFVGPPAPTKPAKPDEK